MFPICRSFVPAFVFDPIGLPERDRKDVLHMYAIAKLLATLAKQGADAFLQGRFSQFDPIVHENSCQIRAFGVIRFSSRKEVLEEAQRLKEAALKIEQALVKLQNRPAVPAEKRSFEEVMAGQGLSLQASFEMTYLLQAYFLTVGKVFQMHKDGSETAYIDYPNLKGRLSKQIQLGFLQRVVDFTQVKLAEASIRFIQSEARPLGGLIEAQLDSSQIERVKPSDPEALERPCSCAFYNFKAIFLRMREENTLIFVQKYGSKRDKPMGVFCRGDSFAPLAEEEVSQLGPKAPVFVIEGFIPEAMDRQALQTHISEASLLDLALMNVARVPQYSSRDFDPKKMDPQAVAEIESFRKRAEALGCSLQGPRIFSIVHTHAAAVGELT